MLFARSYEEFRIWTFVNNIRIRTYSDSSPRPLNDSEVRKILPLFYRKSKSQFSFEDIAKAIAGKGNYSDFNDKAEKPYKFNFKMYASLSLCAINKILPYLRAGYRYDEAVIMANLTAVTGYDTGSEELEEVRENISIIIEDHSKNPLENKRSCGLM